MLVRSTVPRTPQTRKRDKEPGFYMPDGQFIDNVQWHCLLPIDLTYNPAAIGDRLRYAQSSPGTAINGSE